jgi:CarD family transcriptional regulator
MEKRSQNRARFKIGDKAVYPGHGVAQITGLEKREIAGVKKEFYVLKTMDSDIKLLIPVEGVNRTGLRSIIGKREVDEVLGILRAPGTSTANQSWNRRQREYTEMLNSGSVFEIAKVLRDLYQVDREKGLSYSEKRVRDHAQGLLARELALACKYDLIRAEETIKRALESTAAANSACRSPLKILASPGAY